MTQPIVHVQKLEKTFCVPVRAEGLAASLRGLVHRESQAVPAVRGISFDIQPGEVVGFIGPNGAGKTTTLKMLTGLLRPTSGAARVAGFDPAKRQPAFLRQISMVLGNKSQMLWDIPPTDSFRVLAEIYGVLRADYAQRLEELAGLLEVDDLLTRPVRSYSLGERMKCELIAGLLHHPKILFLDEPTLGLDITSRNHLRRFIAEYNRLTGATVLLTSHDMSDVEILCPRILLIHNGSLLYDGSLQGLAEKIAPYKHIRLEYLQNNGSGSLPIPDRAVLVGRGDGSLTLRVDRAEAPRVTSDLLAAGVPITDLLVENPPIEEWIEKAYQGGPL